MKNFPEFSNIEGTSLTEKKENPHLGGQCSTIRLLRPWVPCNLFLSVVISILPAQTGAVPSSWCTGKVSWCAHWHRLSLNTELARHQAAILQKPHSSISLVFPRAKKHWKDSNCTRAWQYSHMTTWITQALTDRSESRGALLSCAHHNLYRTIWKVLLQWEM